MKMENRVAMSTNLVSWLMAIRIITLTGFGEGGHIAPCNRSMFDSHVHNSCLPYFNRSMATSGYQDRCPWPATKGYYIVLRHCVEYVGNVTWCREPSLKDEVFLEVHQTYYSLCPSVEDPPLTIQIMLTVPGIIATLFLPLLCVHLTTWNT